MMERDLAGQSINTGIRGHQHIDWLELSISAATAGFCMGGTTGQNLNEGLQKTFKSATPTLTSQTPIFSNRRPNRRSHQQPLRRQPNPNRKPRQRHR